MKYLFGYTFTGIDENHPLSGSKVNSIIAENDKDAVDIIRKLKNNGMINEYELKKFPAAKCTIDFIYKEESNDLRYSHRKVTSNVVKDFLNSQENTNKTTNTSGHIPGGEAEKILNKIIDYLADNEKNEEAAINKLIKIGFTGESLVDYFGFNMMSVSEVLEELHNKENRTS
ncbi:hypothetical protein [Ruminococcus albus]|uniref:Uncharacterized protein n=1 Tax=Ruminococcus albus (strain ATCC 27210 / DSM 20455 / JCM 14654 / NCDO 2250 / 7) TaxID=697329 RepID=E6UJW2_RUMA7|nr:hypothetical protein [Ruminococcus albus]ADU23958.1 hypothetical protein Rumal_3513 [Ruminococcus albus 7 = DSM 20455]